MSGEYSRVKVPDVLAISRADVLHPCLLSDPELPVYPIRFWLGRTLKDSKNLGCVPRLSSSCRVAL